MLYIQKGWNIKGSEGQWACGRIGSNMWNNNKNAWKDKMVHSSFMTQCWASSKIDVIQLSCLMLNICPLAIWLVLSAAVIVCKVDLYHSGRVLSCQKIVQTRLLRLNLDTRLWLQLMCCAHSQHKEPQFQDPQVKPGWWVENEKETKLWGEADLIFKLQKTYKMMVTKYYGWNK